jgi:hypothetical protein
MVHVEILDMCQCDKKIQHGAMMRGGDKEEMRHMTSMKNYSSSCTQSQSLWYFFSFRSLTASLYMP